MKLMSGTVLLLSITVLLVGCKLEVIVPSGGDVKSESSTRDCIGGSLCEHTITDLTFDETFTAVARPGYVFTGWNEGHGFLCGDSVDSVCKVSLLGIPEGDAAIAAMLASGHIFYVMPQFRFVGIDTDEDGILDHLDEDDDNDGVLDVDDTCPLHPVPKCDPPDSIIVNGREWAQPSQFMMGPPILIFKGIKAICPEGLCNGTLNGYDITGWTWATLEDLRNFLFYYHQDSEFLISGRSSLTMANSPWAPAFFAAGWIPTFVPQPEPTFSQQLTWWTVLLYGPDPDPVTGCCIAVGGVIDLTIPLDGEDEIYYGVYPTPTGPGPWETPMGVLLYRD